MTIKTTMMHIIILFINMGFCIMFSVTLRYVVDGSLG